MTLESVMPSTADEAAFVVGVVLVRSAAVLLGAWCVARLMRRSAAAARHGVWLVGVVATLMLPVLSVAPGWRVLPAWGGAAPARMVESQTARLRATEPGTDGPVRAAQSPNMEAASARRAPPAAPRASAVSWSEIALGLWGVGAALCLTPLIIGRILLARLERRATAVTDSGAARLLAQARLDLGIRRRVSLLRGPSNVMPMAWGLMAPRVLLPRESTGWPASHLRTVLLHELAHIKRHDCLWQLFAQVARAMYWPNPLAWVAVRALHDERERACDDLVLSLGAERAEYADRLLSIASGRALPPGAAAAMAMARPSQIESRIRGILDASRPCRPVTRRGMVIAAMVAAVALIPIAGLRSAQPEPAAKWPPAPLEPAVGSFRPGEEPNYVRCTESLMMMSLLVNEYTHHHDGFMPPDLGSVLQYLDGYCSSGLIKSDADRAKFFLSPEDFKATAIPEKVTPEWINQHTSFVYLGSPDVKVNEVPDWDRTIVVYSRLDQPHYVMQPDGTIRETYCSAVLASHGDYPSPRQQIEDEIAASKRAYAAARSGASADDDNQAIWDLQQVFLAIRGYADAHGGALPPSLGAALPYVAAQTKRLATAAQRAAIFLSPVARRNLVVPENPTRAWVDQHASYTYLGGRDLRMSHIPYTMHTVLLYGELEQPYSIRGANGVELKMVPFVFSNGSAQIMRPDELKAEIDLSRQVLDAVQAGDTIPGLHQAVFDTQRIGVAVYAYAKAHDDHLPPDLGATLPYLNRDLLLRDTSEERAKVYLSPSAEAKAELPSEVTPEWVNQHGNYVYLGNERLTLKDLHEIAKNASLIVHAPLDEQLTLPPPYDASWIAVGFATESGGWGMAYPIYQFESDLGEAVKRLRELQHAGPSH